MDKLNNKTCDLLGILKSWICWRSHSANVSRDFWMPDHSCRVCYECDNQFTLFNRRHHCRLCGRIFCAKCTANSVHASSVYSNDMWDEWDRVRVCNYCFKQWELGLVRAAIGRHDDTDTCHTHSPACVSSSKSGVSAFNSTITINSLSFSLFEHISENCSLSPCQSTVIYPSVDIGGMEESGMTNISMPCSQVSFGNRFDLSTNRSDEDHNDVYGIYPSDTETKICSQTNDYYAPIEFNRIENTYGLHTFVPHMENVDTEPLTPSAFQGIYDVQESDEQHQHQHQHEGKKEDHDMGYECEAPSSSLCVVENVNLEPVDFENNGLLWLPPEPENEEDDRETGLFDFDDDDEDGDAEGEWGLLRTSGSFGSGPHISKDRSAEVPKNAMKNVVEGHFRALITQLLQVENIPVSGDDLTESWLEIITSLSWEAATLLKPDTSRGGGMDPGGYVKVKCIASGLRSESVVVKGVVCKKNVAHRRMAARMEKPRIMILGGDLEYQRVSNLLSSFDTLLQQEMDHLKMAVAKIDAHRPNVLLVEKSVSRYAQDYILAKDISLVLNIKRPLLERIARCTGAQIVPSIDHLSTQKMGYCDLFHVDRCFENHGSAGQAGRKLTKNLMYFEGCPKPLGCTILLRGTNGDELKKVKHVVQYGIFAAYHLSLETSFLADEGASLLDHLLNEPITLPNKSVDKSISVVSGFSTPTSEKQHKFGEPQLPNSISPILPSASSYIQSELGKSEHVGPTSSYNVVYDNISPPCEVDRTHVDNFVTNHEEPTSLEHRVVDEFISEDARDTNACGGEQDANTNKDEPESSLKEEFPSTSSDNQSILVSLSSQCVWKGTVCERAHLFRIKYYGSFDKPLGRFLHDHLFDQSYRCHSCDLSSEAHVQCYTHRQGTLTISVRKLEDFSLSGEREGKIWMWHRCLRCPRMSGFPPATRRVLMSDAAWGLSFGKFLELSFSNNAAASRVAGCGHSLHRDCLRFYGCGKMVACFRYASISVFSVYLPPAKVEFNYESQDWIQKEANEVVNQAEFLFSEVHNAIGKIADGKCDGAGLDIDLVTSKSKNRIGALEGVLQIEKKEFKEVHWKTLNKEVKSGCPTLDILDINRLRRQLLLQSYMWDHRLVYAAGLSEDSFHNDNVGSVLVSVKENLTNTAILHPDLVKRSSHDAARGTKNVLDSPETVNPSSKTSPGLSPYKEDQCDLLGSGSNVRRAMSDSHSLSLSDTLDVAWTGGSQSLVGKDDSFLLGSNCADSSLAAVAEKLTTDNRFEERSGAKVPSSPSPVLSANSKGPENVEDVVSWFGIPFLNLYRSINRNFLRNAQNLDTFGGFSPMYVSSFRDLERQGGAKWLLPIGCNETVIPVYDDEPTSIISYALVSEDYHNQLSDEGEKPKESIDNSLSMPLQQSASFVSLNESMSESNRSLGIEESVSSASGLRNSVMTDQILHFRSLHIRVSFSDNGPLDEVRYTVTCYYAERFDALRKICCPSEIDFVRSLSRCKKWGAQGGKSNVFFAKTLDDRFIIKQVTKTELESFIKFAPEYFKYVMESISTKSPTCLAKILGIFQVTTKHLKGGKESKMDVLVMENLLFRRNVTRLYDLKGSSRSRYNPDSSGSNKVLLDQNLIEAMSTSPIFVGNKAKRLLERAVWNDTSFLASIDVMDYSLLVGVDEENHELVLGIIDFMRQYTWDKHLETWVKASGILGGPKNVSPTVISPMQYKKRFRKAMTTYFLMVPDQWSPPSVIPSQYQTNLCEDNTHCGS